MIDFQTEVKTINLYIIYSKINDDYFCFDHSVVFRKQLKIYLIKNEKITATGILHNFFPEALFFRST